MRFLSLSFVLLSSLTVGALPAPAEQSVTEQQRSEAMAQSVTIRRDEWGVPHIDGPTDASVAFGMAYVLGRIPCVEPYSNPVC